MPKKINPGKATAKLRPSSGDFARFFAKVVEKPCGCWEWQGTIDPAGYGQFWFAGRSWWAHRFAYAALKRGIQAGTEIDHVCHNSSCVNPEHLRQTSVAVNRARTRPSWE
jgi:hypothetical protein